MNVTTVAIAGIIIMLVLLLLGMNIGLSMLIVGFVGYTLMTNFEAALGILRKVPVSTASNYSFVVIPLFVLMGNLALAAGISNGLFRAANKWVSRLPGGLACASVVACAAFGAICGSGPATVATMGTVAVPAMREHGYKDELSAGTVTAGGTLGIMIPPSTNFVVYAMMAEMSIGRMFAAGILPGIMTALVLIIFVVIRVKLNPSLAPQSETRYTLKEKITGLKDIIGMAILFVIVLIGMFTGLFTVNEAAAIGSLAALIMTIVLKRFTWKKLLGILMDTVKTCAMIYVVLIGASVFGKFLAITELPMRIAEFVAGLNVSPTVIIIAIAIIYAIMGCVFDALPMITLTVPIFLPIIESLGYDPIWFGVFIILLMQLGMVTPPVGVCSYVMAGTIKDIQLSTVFRGVLPFVPAFLIAILIVIFVPPLSTWLPSLLF